MLRTLNQVGTLGGQGSRKDDTRSQGSIFKQEIGQWVDVCDSALCEKLARALGVRVRNVCSTFPQTPTLTACSYVSEKRWQKKATLGADFGPLFTAPTPPL